MPYKLRPAELKRKWLEYRKKCDELYIDKVRYRETIIEVPRRYIYGLTAFCCYAGIAESDLDAWQDHERYTLLVKQIKNEVLARKLDALVNGEGSTGGLIFDLKCNYGLYPKKATDEKTDWKITMDLGNDSIGEPPAQATKWADRLAGTGADNPPEDEHTPYKPVFTTALQPPQPPGYGKYCII